MDKSTRQKINKETQALNDELNQMDLIDIYRTFHPKATEYTFFSSADGTLSKIDHILGFNFKKIDFKTILNFKKIETLRKVKSYQVTLRKWKSYQASLPTTTPYD